MKFSTLGCSLCHPAECVSLCSPISAGSRAGQVGEWSDQWKVLVYDKPCRNIISTLLHVTQLRKQGVTLHMLVRLTAFLVYGLSLHVEPCQCVLILKNLSSICVRAQGGGGRCTANLCTDRAECARHEVWTHSVLVTKQRKYQSFVHDFFFDAAGNGAGGHPRRARDLFLPTDCREYETHRRGRWQEALQVS